MRRSGHLCTSAKIAARIAAPVTTTERGSRAKLPTSLESPHSVAQVEHDGVVASRGSIVAAAKPLRADALNARNRDDALGERQGPEIANPGRARCVCYAKVCTITGPAIAEGGPASSGVRLFSIHASARLLDSSAPA